MMEVFQNLFVGAEFDAETVLHQPGWFVIHACKEPYHRAELGYTGRAAPKEHPEYLIAERPGRLILNIVDAPNVAYIPPQIIDKAIAEIDRRIGTSKVLVHCNEGLSRSPTIALLYLAKFVNRFHGMDAEAAMQGFRRIYPPYAPKQGMADYVRLNWAKYSA
jgi:hypothetical protein